MIWNNFISFVLYVVGVCCVRVIMDLSQEDISWLTQTDSGNANFDITGQFMSTMDVGLVSLEDNDGRVELYDGVFAEIFRMMTPWTLCKFSFHYFSWCLDSL